MQRRVWLGVLVPCLLGALLGANLPRRAEACSCDGPTYELSRVSEQTDDDEEHLQAWPERAVLEDRSGDVLGRTVEEVALGSLDEDPAGLVSVVAHAP